MRNNNIKSRVLVVDDNPKNIQILASHLRDDNYEVEYASSGKNAVTMVEKEEFDLILLDVMMPGIDGFETCKRIKNIESKKHIPIIFVTAKTDVDSLALGFDYGGVDYITKPFKADELLLRVATHIELKKARDLLNYHKTYLEKREAHFIEQINLKNSELKKQARDFEYTINTQSEIIKLFSEVYNSSLNKISTPVNLLKLQNLDEKSTDLVNSIETLLRSNSKTAEFLMTNQSLFTKKEKVLKIVSFSLERIVAEFIGEKASLLRTRNISIKTEFESNVKVNGDKNLMSHVIKGLIINALSNSVDDSEITIKITSLNEGSSLTISDLGPGFTKDYILYPYKPVYNDETEDYGLGLFMAKYITDLHNFEMKIGNNPDRGAFVRIVFPG
jgi:two-component system sensor histidine kinase/response regulator